MISSSEFNFVAEIYADDHFRALGYKLKLFVCFLFFFFIDGTKDLLVVFLGFFGSIVTHPTPPSNFDGGETTYNNDGLR
jgi:hypothetical protein